MLVLRRWLRVLKISPAFLILICSGCLLWLWSLRQDNNHIVLTDFWDDGNVDHYGDDDVLWSDGSIDSYADRSLYRTANESSTFWLTYKKLEQLHSDPGNYDSLVSGLCPSVAWSNDILREEKRFLREWDDENPRVRRLNRCKLLVSGMYQLNATWTNAAAYTLVYDIDTDLDNAVLLTERMRVYNYCFLKGDLNTLDVFKAEYLKENNFTVWDFQYRMFPFLNSSFDYKHEFLWPKVVDLFSDDFPTTVHETLDTNGPSPLEFNANFMSNFIRMSKGKGIVTTMDAWSIGMFDKQLRVLDKLNNTLPIQVVSVGGELTQSYYIRLSNAVRNSKQRVYLINLVRILDRDFCEQYIKGFFHKWFATLFNTFSEELFLDVDAVPFKQPAGFFDIAAYTKSGAHFYRDRVWGGKHYRTCNSLLVNLRPTYEERKLLGTRLFLENHEISKDSELDLGPDAAAKVYDNFFNKRYLHNIDSGLMVLDKSKGFVGILQGLFMHVILIFSSCSYGDKEFYWLGQLFMGEEFSVDPYGGGVFGSIRETYDKNKHTTVYKICGGQIAHCDGNNKLSWVNGGLALCKSKLQAVRDIKMGLNEFFPGITDVKKLGALYSRVQRFEGLIVPRIEKWESYANCATRVFCAIYETSDKKPFSPYDYKFIRFQPRDIEFYQEIGSIWKNREKRPVL